MVCRQQQPAPPKSLPCDRVFGAKVRPYALLEYRPSFLAGCVDRGMFETPATGPAERYEPFWTRSHITLASEYVHPLDRAAHDEAIARRCELRAHMRARLIEVLRCEKTVRVLLAIFDDAVTRAEVARCLGRRRDEVTREVQRLQRYLAQNW